LLHATDGVRRGETVPLDQPAITVGRASDNALVIPASDVSRHHARIDLIDGVPRLEDIGSTNGTRVNGQHPGLRGDDGRRVPVNLSTSSLSYDWFVFALRIAFIGLILLFLYQVARVTLRELVRIGTYAPAPGATFAAPAGAV
ncbi:unnamed protein product, partial [Phaeothamnion confervicola]